MEDGCISFSAGGKCAALQQTAALKIECIHKVKKNFTKKLKPALSSTSALKIKAVQSLKMPLILAHGISGITIFKSLSALLLSTLFQGLLACPQQFLVVETSRFALKALLKAGWKHFPGFTRGRREGEVSL